MNYKSLAKIFLCLIIHLSVVTAVSAQSYNNTVMTTSDSAPTYPASGDARNTEVVIGTASQQTAVTTTVTLTSTCIDGGKVTMSYTMSSGVSFASGYPQGSNTGTEIAKFSFDSTTIGKVNTINVIVAGRLDSSGAYCSVDNSNAPTFKICVPQITAKRSPGDTTTNTFEKSVFTDIVVISGCDDFNQIEWVQMLTDTQDYTDYSGSSHNIANYGGGTIDWPGTAGSLSDPPSPSGWASPGGTSGWTFTVSGQTATLNPADGHGDSTAASSTGTFQIGGAGQVYYYTVSSSIACTFQDKICRTGDTGNILGEYDWSYSWDNHNIKWPVSPNVPTVAQFTTATGNTSGVYGGTARSGSGANAGEWTNVNNISVP